MDLESLTRSVRISLLSISSFACNIISKSLEITMGNFVSRWTSAGSGVLLNQYGRATGLALYDAKSNSYTVVIKPFSTEMETYKTYNRYGFDSKQYDSYILSRLITIDQLNTLITRAYPCISSNKARRVAVKMYSKVYLMLYLLDVRESFCSRFHNDRISN